MLKLQRGVWSEGSQINSCIGSFLRSFPNLKESLGATCFKKNQKDFLSLLKGGLQKEG